MQPTIAPETDLPNAGVRQEMIEYIREHFSQLLGPHVALLDQPDGLDQIEALIRSGRIGPRARELNPS